MCLLLGFEPGRKARQSGAKPKEEEEETEARDTQADDRPTDRLHYTWGRKKKQETPSLFLSSFSPDAVRIRDKGGREAVGRVEKLLRLECRRRRRPEEKGERVQVTGGGGQATTRSVRLPRLIPLLFFLILFSLGIRAFGWW